MRISCNRFPLQLCHVAIWGSIASWFIFLLIYCVPDLALYIAPDMIGQVCWFTASMTQHILQVVSDFGDSGEILAWFSDGPRSGVRASDHGASENQASEIHTRAWKSIFCASLASCRVASKFRARARVCISPAPVSAPSPKLETSRSVFVVVSCFFVVGW